MGPLHIDVNFSFLIDPVVIKELLKSVLFYFTVEYITLIIQITDKQKLDRNFQDLAEILFGSEIEQLQIENCLLTGGRKYVI